jgi:hypothetical protein
MLMSNLLKKFFFNAPKNVKIKTSLTNMSESENAYFRHIFAKHFFVYFVETF